MVKILMNVQVHQSLVGRQNARFARDARTYEDGIDRRIFQVLKRKVIMIIANRISRQSC